MPIAMFSALSSCYPTARETSSLMKAIVMMQLLLSCTNSRWVAKRAMALHNVVRLEHRRVNMVCRFQSCIHGGAIPRRATNMSARRDFELQLKNSLIRNRRELHMASPGKEEDMDLPKTIESEWNTPALKKEVQRQSMRCLKKTSKAYERWTKAKTLVEELTSNPDASLEELEKCPNVNELEVEVKELQERLNDLKTLEKLLGEIKNKGQGVVLPKEVAELAIKLEVDDKPPQRPPRGPPKPKGSKSTEPHRLPYRRFYSYDNIEIRVGKKAEDNDVLSLSPQHRDGSDFWMHAAGCPGSHVVIRSNGRTSLPEEVTMDAAALAARHSKASGGSVVPVSMTVCRDVVKPPGAKAGLVQLRGKVRTIKVNMKEAKSRLERLDTTELVN